MKVSELKKISMNDYILFIYLDKEERAIYPPSDMNIDDLKVIGVDGRGSHSIICYIADENSNYTVNDCY